MRKIINMSCALLLSPTTLPALADTPTYADAPCLGDYSAATQKVECGVLTVDESFGKSNGRKVALPVVIVRAEHPKAGALPVIFLHGGPGGGVLKYLPKMLSGPIGKELIGQDQDWVFFDQRGGRLAAPVLDCGDVRLNDTGPLSDEAAQSLMACAGRHEAAGVDLSAYNSVEVAHDLQALRKQLHIDTFNLFSVSYGTRVAFTTLTKQAAGINAVVLDSVWPKDAQWAAGTPLMISKAVDLLLDRCAHDSRCNGKYPDGRQQLTALAERFLKAPQQSQTGNSYSASDFGAFLMDAVYDPDGARALPRDIAALYKGDFSAIDAQNFTSGYAKAMHMAFLCKEEIPFERREDVAKGTENNPVAQLTVPALQRYFDACSAYHVGKPDVSEKSAFASDVPALFLSAEIDPGCPPDIAEKAAKLFSHSKFVMVPNTNHGVFRNSVCGRKIIRAYLNDQNAPIDTSCLHPEHDTFSFEL